MQLIAPVAPPLAASTDGRLPCAVADDLDPREAERIRRRDQDMEVERRALMNPGMGKVFKQIQDAQRKAAGEQPPGRKRRRNV